MAGVPEAGGGHGERKAPAAAGAPQELGEVAEGGVARVAEKIAEIVVFEQKDAPVLHGILALVCRTGSGARRVTVEAGSGGAALCIRARVALSLSASHASPLRGCPHL